MADEIRALFRLSGPDVPQNEVTVTSVGVQAGRTGDNDLVLGHAQISRRHMRLYVQGDAVFVEDLGSSNGTRVNEERLEPNTPRALRIGDTVSLGPFVLTLLEIITPQPEPPPVPEPEPAPPPPEPEPEPEPEPPPPPAPRPRAEEPPPPAPEPEPEPPPPPPVPRPRPAPKPREPEPEPPPPARMEAIGGLEIPAREVREAALARGRTRAPSRVDGYDTLGYLHGVPRPPDYSNWMQYLPAIYSEDHFLGRYLLICESLFAPLVWMVDNFDLYLSPEVAPTEWLQWMASWFDLLLVDELPEARMRAIMDQIGWLYLRRGTRAGLERLLQLYFGVRPQIVEGPEACKFTVRLPLSASDVNLSRDVIERLIASQKPAHTAFTLEIT
jgi:phage tail-like protein